MDERVDERAVFLSTVSCERLLLFRSVSSSMMRSVPKSGKPVCLILSAGGFVVSACSLCTYQVQESKRWLSFDVARVKESRFDALLCVAPRDNIQLHLELQIGPGQAKSGPIASSSRRTVPRPPVHASLDRLWGRFQRKLDLYERSRGWFSSGDAVASRKHGRVGLPSSPKRTVLHAALRKCATRRLLEWLVIRPCRRRET